MSDCRFILDNLNDQVAVTGKLITGSDVIDISGAQMTAGADSWQVKISTAGPAFEHPRLPATVALYLDSDGRFENNAALGPRLGADEVYGQASSATGWRTVKEIFIPNKNAFIEQPTEAKFTFENNAYVLNIPFSELPKDAKAYWRVGIGIKDGDNLTVDYAPDSGYSCATALVAANPVAVKVKSWLQSEWIWQAAIYAVVIIALAVIFWLKRKNKKKKV
jgi:hypothetical protein